MKITVEIECDSVKDLPKILTELEKLSCREIRLKVEGEEE